MGTRNKIPSTVEAEVMFRSNRQCIVCDDHKLGDHIHHIDGNKNNNDFDNLALLCFYCHNDASITNNIKKKLSAATIIKFRDYKYQEIASQRVNSLKKFNSQVEGLTTEDILEISKTAQIIIELEKIKEEYLSASWSERPDILNKLSKYSYHTNFRLAIDIFHFLMLASDQTRNGMTTKVASSILLLILEFFPHNQINVEEEEEKAIELCHQCIDIAFSIVYDSAIYLMNYDIAMHGLTIYKHVYQKGQELDINEIQSNVDESYDQLEGTLQRPERSDLSSMLNLVREFRKDIKKGSLAFPPLPEHLMELINSERRKRENPNR